MIKPSLRHILLLSGTLFLGMHNLSATPAIAQTSDTFTKTNKPDASASSSNINNNTTPNNPETKVKTNDKDAINASSSQATPSDLPKSSNPPSSQKNITQIQTIPGMPPVTDSNNIFSEASKPEHIAEAVKHDLARIYVPNLRSDSVSVIDPKTKKVVDTFKVGRSPQHIVPSWDLRTLWVTNNSEGHPDGSLTPIDPTTGKPGKSIAVDDPYNMYFTPDGRYAVVVAEALRRLDFRDPHSMKLEFSISTPQCAGVNHADWSEDGRYAIFTCEFHGYLTKVDMVNHKVAGYLKLSKGGMPQDIRISPQGHKFYVADMLADGVFIIDGDKFKEIGFIPTGVGAHGMYLSRDTKYLYVANRGTHRVHGKPGSKKGNVSVVDLASEKVVKTWLIPGGGSPDMGNVSADGKTLWLSGRFDDVAYAFDTENGDVAKVTVGMEPHGLTVWPQPGRYSIGHTGLLR